MLKMTPLALLLALAAPVFAQISLNNPTDTTKVNQGSNMTAQWGTDGSGTWDNMQIELMTGSDQTPKSLAVLSSGIDATVETQASFVVPNVNPNAPIYWLRFSQGGNANANGGNANGGASPSPAAASPTDNAGQASPTDNSGNTATDTSGNTGGGAAGGNRKRQNNNAVNSPRFTIADASGNSGPAPNGNWGDGSLTSNSGSVGPQPSAQTGVGGTGITLYNQGVTATSLPPGVATGFAEATYVSSARAASSLDWFSGSALAMALGVVAGAAILV